MRFVFLKICLFSLALSSILSCSNSDGGGSSRPQTGLDPSEFSSGPKDCKDFIAELPDTYFYDWIQVPENPSDVNGPQIYVFYYGLKKLSENVVAFYNGGPGSDSHGSFFGFEYEIKNRKLEKSVSFIYIDQRGNGCSSAYPTNANSNDILRARWYGSTSIVHDSEAIRRKLFGEKKWKVFGQSYGAFIVHRYASLFPESLKAAYAHANTINANADERFYSRIFSQYRVLNMYLSNYPEDREKLLKLKNYLQINKCFETQFVGKVCGHEIMEAMVYSIGFSNRWNRLHEDLTKLVPQNGPSDEQIKKFITSNIDEPYPNYGLSLSTIGFYDRNVSVADYPVCLDIYNRLKSQGIAEDQLLINECMVTIQHKYISDSAPLVKSVLNNQHDHLTLEKFKNGLLRMSPKTFYIYSGEKDAFVPKENFTEEINALGGLLNYTHFMNSGHEGCRTEDKVWEDLTRSH